MAKLAMVRTTWDEIVSTSDTVFTNRDTGKTLIKKGSLIVSPATQVLTGAMKRIGSAQIPSFGAKYMIIALILDVDTSTGIRLQLVGGPTVAGGFTKEFTNKEVAADLTTRSDAVNAIPDGDYDKFLDFKLLRAPEFMEVEIMATVVGGSAGLITQCDIYLMFDT